MRIRGPVDPARPTEEIQAGDDLIVFSRVQAVREPLRQEAGADRAAYSGGRAGFRCFAKKRQISARDSLASFVSRRLNAWPPGASS